MLARGPAPDDAVDGGRMAAGTFPRRSHRIGVSVSDSVVILGATGRVGAVTIDLALADGFRVTAVARTPEQVRREHPRLTVVQGDTTDVHSLERALREAAPRAPGERGAESSEAGGAPTVVMAVGANPLRPSTVVTDTVANLVRVMPELGLHRYLGVGGVAQMPATPAGRVTQTVIRRGIKAAVDHQHAYDALVASELDWVVAGCPYIRDGHPSGRALEHRAPFPGGFRVVSPRDVAVFLARHLQDRTAHRQIIGLW